MNTEKSKMRPSSTEKKMKTLPSDCTSDIHKNNTQCGLHQISVFVKDNDWMTGVYTKVPATNNDRVHLR